MNQFFSDKGLTSTSANHICNIAKEYVENIKTELDDIKLCDIEMQLIGENTATKIQNGTSNLSNIMEKLETIGQCHSLIAWLREAVKEKSFYTNKFTTYSVYDYCKDHNIVPPLQELDHTEYTKEDWLNSLSIKTRNRYYALSAQLAVIGKFIHPNGAFAKERKKAFAAKNSPYSKSGEGRDCIIYTTTPSATPEEIDKIFFDLQAYHRELQAELNSLNNDYGTKLFEYETNRNIKNQQIKEEYSKKMDKLRLEADKYTLNELDRIKNLKIIIPDSLKSIYNTVSKN